VSHQGFDTWQFLKKIKIKKRLKKNKKIQRLTHDKVVNAVCEDLTDGTTLIQQSKLGTKLRQSSKWVPF